MTEKETVFVVVEGMYEQQPKTVKSTEEKAKKFIDETEFTMGHFIYEFEVDGEFIDLDFIEG